MISSIHKTRRSVVTYDIDFTHVDSGLSLTPSQMLKMSESGVPISVSSLSPDNFIDGEISVMKDVPLFQQRGIEAVDIAEFQSKSRSKVQSYLSSLNNVG